MDKRLNEYEFDGTLAGDSCRLPGWVQALGCGCLEVMAYLIVIAAGCGLTLLVLGWRGYL